MPDRLSVGGALKKHKSRSRREHGAHRIRSRRVGTRSRKTILLSLLAGAVAGAGAAIVVRSGDSGTDEMESYYLSRLCDSGHDPAKPGMLLLTPRAVLVPPALQDRLSIRVANDSYEREIRPYFGALGSPGFEAAGELLPAVAGHLEQAWELLRDLAQGPAGDPPLRVLIQHHPRPGLPGHCVTIQTTFYTVPDPALDAASTPLGDTDRVRGQILQLRKTYQLDAEPRRLIQASVEAQPEVIVHGPRRNLGSLAGREDVGSLAGDEVGEAYFTALGGGVRYGLAWFDLSAGLDEPQEWGAAFRIRWPRNAAEPKVETEALAGRAIAQLLEFVRRS